MTGSVIWITGLPGSGKTTLAKFVKLKFEETGVSPILLDGDEMRIALNNTFGYEKSERIEAAKIYVNFASLLEKQGHLVIVSTVSLFDELHDYRNSKLPNHILVLVNAEEKLLDSRNQKNLRSANTQYSPGVNLSIELPLNPDLVLRGDESASELESVFEKLKAGVN